MTIDGRAYLRRAYAALPGKLPLFERLRRHFALPEPLYRHLHFTGSFEVTINEEHRFNTFSDASVVENELFWAGLNGWESTSLKVWTALCNGQSGHVLDVGANSGTYALIAGAVAPRGQITAFEPVARNCKVLRRNIALNRFRVAVEQVAVTAKSGPVVIYDVVDAPLNYSASLEGQGEHAVAYEVHGISLDNWLAARDDAPVAAIKIDVEGHEPSVLDGFSHTIRAKSPPILIEILSENAAKECEERLQGSQYQRFRIVEQSGIRPADRLAAAEGHDWNWLLCTEQQIQDRKLSDFILRS